MPAQLVLSEEQVYDQGLDRSRSTGRSVRLEGAHRKRAQARFFPSRRRAGTLAPLSSALRRAAP